MLPGRARRRLVAHRVWQGSGHDGEQAVRPGSIRARDYLAGYNGDTAGFGNAVLNGMSWAAAAFGQLNQTMDLVFVEQRGTSGSGL